MTNIGSTTIRVYFEQPNGQFQDGQDEIPISMFGGTVPNVGDIYLAPGVTWGDDRSLAANRKIWEVRKRVFNPRDQEDYVAVVFLIRPLTPSEEAFLPNG